MARAMESARRPLPPQRAAKLRLRSVLFFGLWCVSASAAAGDGLAEESAAGDGGAQEKRFEAIISPFYFWLPAIKADLGAQGLSTSVDVKPIDIIANLDTVFLSFRQAASTRFSDRISSSGSIGPRMDNCSGVPPEAAWSSRTTATS